MTFESCNIKNIKKRTCTNTPDVVKNHIDVCLFSGQHADHDNHDTTRNTHFLKKNKTLKKPLNRKLKFDLNELYFLNVGILVPISSLAPLAQRAVSAIPL